MLDARLVTQPTVSEHWREIPRYMFNDNVRTTQRVQIIKIIIIIQTFVKRTLSASELSLRRRQTDLYQIILDQNRTERVRNARSVKLRRRTSRSLPAICDVAGTCDESQCSVA